MVKAEVLNFVCDLDQWWHHEQVTWVKACVDRLGICAFQMKEGKTGEMRRKAVRDDRSSDGLSYTMFFYPHDLPLLIHHRLGCSGAAPGHLQNYLLGLKLGGHSGHLPPWRSAWDGYKAIFFKQRRDSGIIS